jgi:hypothetical protein
VTKVPNFMKRGDAEQLRGNSVGPVEVTGRRRGR